MSINAEGFEDRPVPVRPLDDEQARMLEILRTAGGEPVTFGELRSRGIDNPAMLCYELEIAGLPIKHVERAQPGGGPVPVGVQLEEPWLTAPEAPEPRRRTDALVDWLMLARKRAGAAALASRRLAGAWGDRVNRRLGAGAVALRSRSLPGAGHLRGHAVRWRRGSRGGMLLAAPVLLVLALLAVVLASATKHSGATPTKLSARAHSALLKGISGSSAPRASRLQVAHRAHSTSEGDGLASSEGSLGAHGPDATGAGTASQLQSEGHQLLAEGRYAAAAADLRAALSASRVSTAGCEEPSSDACLTYAYALYDLGRALQLEHDPSAAVPVLNARLRIDNQRSTVLAALRSARSQLHSGSQAHPAHPHGGHSPPAHPRSNSHPESSGEPPAPEGAQPQGHPNTTTPEAEGGGGPGSGSQNEGSPHEYGPGGVQAPSTGTPG